MINIALGNWRDCFNSKGKEREEQLSEITQRNLASGQKNLQEQLCEAFLNMENQMYTADRNVKAGIIYSDL